MTTRCAFAYSLTDKEPVARSQIDREQDGGDEDVWHCPHGPMADSTYCPFHAPIERKDRATVATALQELMTGDVDAPPELIGAQFSTLDLSGMVIDHGATPVDLRDIDVSGGLRFEYTDIRSPVRLTDASIETDLTLDSATIAGDLTLNDASIGGDLSAEGAEVASVTANRLRLNGDIHLDDIRVDNQFLLRDMALGGSLRVQNGTFDGLLALTAVSFGRSVDFESTTFGGRVDLQASLFEAEVGFRDVTFDRALLLEEAAFNAPVRFDGATFARAVAIPDAMFRDEVSFTGAQFDAGLRLAQSRFDAPVRFDGAVFDGVFTADRASFLESVQFAGVTFDATATFDDTAFAAQVGFTDAVFAADASFDSTLFEDEVDFETAVFRGELTFAPAAADHTEARVFDLQGVELRAGELATPGQDDVIDLTNATLGDITLIGDDDTSLEQFRLVNVRFDRFDFTEKRFRDQLAADGWTLHTTLEDDTTQSLPRRAYRATLGRLLMTAPSAAQTPAADNRDLETTYLRAKNGADDDGYTTGAAEFFINEKVYRRRTYINGTDSTDNRVAAGINYLANIGLAVTTGYGERPFRPVFASLLTIGLYALAYLLLFDPPLLSGAGLWEHALFSGQNFVAFVVGPPPEQSGSLLFRLTTALEAFTGAFFVALFVFSLTRSVDR
jgi:hypothetical protein